MLTNTPIEPPLILKIDDAIIEMIKVQGGRYQIGREKNNPTIILSDFWIGKFPVTQLLYTTVMGTNPAHFEGEHKPVEQVNWIDCKLFMTKLNEYEGVKRQHLFFRLPTEAEWEYAASDRGTTSYEYAGDDDLPTVGWYDDNSPNQSMAVGLKKPNYLGIYDMTGNVWEWCEDDYDDDTLLKTPTEMPNPINIGGSIMSIDNILIDDEKRLTPSPNKVNRGGSWRDGVRCCRLVNRDTYTASLRLDIIGFRLVCVHTQ
jgi:formylglycine-generating enzyme